MTENELLGIVGSISHEVRQSFYYMFSAYCFLDGKVPETARELLTEIGRICQKLRKEIDAFPSNIDQQSAGAASGQIRSYAIKWKKETDHLSYLINEIKNLNIQMENHSLNEFLNEILSHSLQNFSKLVDSMTAIQAKDLITKHI